MSNRIMNIKTKTFPLLFNILFLLFRSNWTIGLKYENMKKWIKKISHIEFLNANPTARMCHFLICVCLINPTV